MRERERECVCELPAFFCVCLCRHCDMRLHWLRKVCARVHALCTRVEELFKARLARFAELGRSPVRPQRRRAYTRHCSCTRCSCVPRSLELTAASRREEDRTHRARELIERGKVQH